MDEDLRTLARDARTDDLARFRLHAEIDRRFFPEAAPLTESVEEEVLALGTRLSRLLQAFDEVAPLELARGIVAPSLGAEAIRWEWIERSLAVVLIVHEAGTVTIDGDRDGLVAPYSEDDDGANVGERFLHLEPRSPAAAFASWARAERFCRVREEVALRLAHRVIQGADVGGMGQNTGSNI